MSRIRITTATRSRRRQAILDGSAAPIREATKSRVILHCTPFCLAVLAACGELAAPPNPDGGTAVRSRWACRR
jgi:hypothetical protein